MKRLSGSVSRQQGADRSKVAFNRRRAGRLQTGALECASMK